MGKKKKIILSLVVLAVVAAALAGVYFLTKPQTHQGAKHITVDLVGKESSRTVQIDTDEEMLGAALVNEQLVEGDQGEFGLFITTVDGYTADADAQEWWCLTKGGEYVNTSADSTPIADGVQFELTLKTGW